jgi:hypothetical protein
MLHSDTDTLDETLRCIVRSACWKLQQCGGDVTRALHQRYISHGLHCKFMSAQSSRPRVAVLQDVQLVDTEHVHARCGISGGTSAAVKSSGH